jgi:hypothetical protein
MILSPVACLLLAKLNAEHAVIFKRPVSHNALAEPRDGLQPGMKRQAIQPMQLLALAQDECFAESVFRAHSTSIYLFIRSSDSTK